MRVRYCVIQNISNQIIGISYSKIHPRRSVTSIPPRRSGISHIASNCSLEIESSRLDAAQIQRMVKFNLIKMSCSYRNVEVSVSNRFSFEIADNGFSTSADAFEIGLGESFSISPVVTSGKSSYWQAVDLPSNFVFDNSTGEISGVISPDNQLNTPLVIRLIGVSTRMVIRELAISIVIPSNLNNTGLLSFTPTIGVIGFSGSGILLRA